MKKNLKKIGVMILILSAGIASFKFAQLSFIAINEMRQLERVPPTNISSSISGVVSLDGFVREGEALLNSELTDTPSVYYRYLIEEEETDSDGNTSWTTRLDQSNAVTFTLFDGETTARVEVTENSKRPIDWRLEHSAQETKGRFRYTEWIIVPGDKVFIFAFFDGSVDAPSVRFDRGEDYTPIISMLGEFEARSAKGGSSILWLILAITCLSVVVYGCVWFFKIHRVLTYLTAFSISVFLLLFHFGSIMVKQDVDIALRYYEKQIVGAEKKLLEKLRYSGVETQQQGDGESIFKQGQLLNGKPAVSDVSNKALTGLRDSLRLHLLKSNMRINRQYSRFPYRQLLWVTGNKIGPLPFQPTNEERDLAIHSIDELPTSRLTGWWTLAMPALFTFLFVLFWWLGLRSVKTKRLIENIPSSPCQGVVYGITEIVGMIDAGHLMQLTAPLTKQKAVWCHYIVEEKRGSGKNAKWVTLSNEKTGVPFSCRDSTGSIGLDLVDAEVITHRTEIKLDGSQRYTEHILCHGDSLYCLGSAQVSREGDQLVLGKSEDVPLIVSNKSEFEIMLGKARLGIALWNGAMIFALSAAIILFGAQGGLAPSDFLLAALGAPTLLLAMMAMLHYNDLVFLKQRVDRNYANILVSLTKRKDLIPALVQITQTYSGFEASLQTVVTEMRNDLKELTDKNVSLDHDAQTDNIRRYLQSESNCLQKIRILKENYPQLKADHIFQKLFSSLVALENEVSFMRIGFNDSVEAFNTRCETFPDNILARVFSFKLKKYAQEL